MTNTFLYSIFELLKTEKDGFFILRISCIFLQKKKNIILLFNSIKIILREKQMKIKKYVILLSLLIIIPSLCYALDKPKYYEEIKEKINEDNIIDYSIIIKITPFSPTIFDFEYPYPLDPLINLSTLEIGCSNIQDSYINNSNLHLKIYERIKKGNSLFICINYSTYPIFELEPNEDDIIISTLFTLDTSQYSTYSINVTYSLPYNLDFIDPKQKYYVPFIIYPSEWETYDSDLKTNLTSRNPISINFYKERKGDENSIFFSNMIYYLFKTNPTIKLTQNDIHSFPDPNGKETITFSNNLENKIIKACVKHDNYTNLIESIYFLTNKSQICNGEYYNINPKDTRNINRASFFNYASNKCNYSSLEKLGFPFDCVEINGTRDIGSIFDESQNPFDLDISYVMTIKPKADYILDTKKSSICILPFSICIPEMNLFGTTYPITHHSLNEEEIFKLGGCNSEYFTIESQVEWIKHRIRSRELKTFKSSFTKINQTNNYHSDNINFKMNIPSLTYKIHYTLVFYRSITQKIILFMFYFLTILAVFGWCDKLYFAYKRNAKNKKPRRRKVLESIKEFLGGDSIEFTKNKKWNLVINLILLILIGGGGLIGFYKYYGPKELVNIHNPLLFLFPLIVIITGFFLYRIYLKLFWKGK